MCSTTWLNITFFAECIGFLLSLTANLILLYLIYEKPVQTFGNYKYLMLSFSALGILYSCGNFWAKPTVHITRTSFIVFTVLKNSGLSKDLGVIVICIYVSFYGMMLSIFCIQFLYRYTAVISPLHISSRFSLKTFPIFVLLVVLHSLLWFYVAYFMNGPDPEKDQELSLEFGISYCMTPSEYAYAGAKFFYLDKNGSRIYHFLPFLATFIMSFMMFATLFCSTYLGVRTYSTLKRLRYGAQSTDELQHQLFRTLVIQTTIPFVFMYFPVGCMFLIPILGWEIGGISNMIPISVAIYPCFEPLVAIYCIKCFRERIKHALFRQKNRVATVQASLRT